MKKIILTLLLLSSYIYGDSTEIFLEYNFDRKVDLKNNPSLEKEDRDFGVNLEFYSPPKGNLLGGFGIINNEINLTEAQKLNLTTYYLVNKFYFGKSQIKMYGKLQAGGYYPSTVFEKTAIIKPSIVEIANGFFYGASLGIEYKNFMLQSSYKSYLGDSKVDNQKAKFEYETINMSLGYNIAIE